MGTEGLLFSELPEDAFGEDAVRRVLESVADVVIRQTPYRRVAVACYEEPVTTDPTSKTRLREYAVRGLSDEDEESILRFVADGRSTAGGKFRSESRIGDCYYLREGTTLDGSPLRIPSHRRYLDPEGWHRGDTLIVPIIGAGGIIGTISVDDPRDGARPSRAVVRRLEELAEVAAVAVCEACSLVRLTERDRLFQFLTENAMTGLVVAQGSRFRYANERAGELFGCLRDELLAMEPWWQVIHPEERRLILKEGIPLPAPNVTVRGLRKDGSPFWVQLRGWPMTYEEQPATVLNLLDVTETVNAEHLLKERALRDPLTGLFNRHYFDDSIHTELKRSQRYKRSFTLVMTDLARFKEINDRFGHQRGDQVLRDVAQVVLGALRESDWAIRYGGDEFLLVLPETGTRIEALTQRLETSVSDWAAKQLPGAGLRLDLGWATWTPESNLTISRLLQLADSRLYEEKRARHVADAGG